jgi:predicted PurR-regulated permease PerM
MTVERRLVWWLIGLGVLFAALFLLSGILLPFVLGLAIAYLLDPLADVLERRRVPRWVAAGAITLVSVLAVIAALLLLAPLLQSQLLDFAERIPHYAELIRERAMTLFEAVQERLTAEEISNLRAQIGAFAGQDAVAWLGGLVRGLWGGGVALLNALSVVVITPIVTFYLLRDWDRIVAHVERLVPGAWSDAVSEQAREIDRVLAGFVRGQMTVCALLGIFYGVGLSLIGLDFGLVIGLGTGLISFVPYFGMLVGFVTGIGVALAQFDGWQPVAMVAAVFIVGQFIEGNFISPRLVGEKVGLHPVWMIFALMAGGALFGFLGILLAVPAAAVIGVLVRFWTGRYAPDPDPEQDPAGDDGDTEPPEGT